MRSDPSPDSRTRGETERCRRPEPASLLPDGGDPVGTDLLNTAGEAIARGEVVVYPTETVYGLGTDATDPEAVGRIFEIKDRPRDNPLSIGVQDVETALRYTQPSERSLSFMREMLPGPVTVVVERGGQLPDVLTAGKDRVGVRIPAHETARRLFTAAGTPVTATSANRSGAGSIRETAALSPGIRDRARVVIDGGKAPGGGSTVVDPERGIIHRRGRDVEAVEAWLDNG